MPAKKVGKSSSKKTSVKNKKVVSKSKAARPTKVKKKQTKRTPATKSVSGVQKTKAKKKEIKTEPKKNIAQNNQSKQEKNTSLLILSPFRFPLDVDLVVVRTARYSGVFFVLVGALLTLFHSNLFFNNEISKASNTYTATVIDSVLEIKDETITHPTEIPFSVDFSKEMPLREEVEINLQAENDLQSIHVTAYNTNSGHEVDFGKMESDDARNWKMKVDTTGFNDGDYILKFSVSSFAELYESVDKTKVSIENYTANKAEEIKNAYTRTFDNEFSTYEENDTEIVDKDTNQVEEEQKSEPEDKEESVEEVDKVDSTNADIAITGDMPHDGKETISVYPKRADKVKIIAVNEKTDEEHILGYAYDKTATHWKYIWDTTEYSDGAYIINALIIDGDETYKSTSLEVTVLNQRESEFVEIEKELQDEIRITSDKDLLEELAAVSEVTVRSDSPVSENTEVRIETARADFVEVYAVRKVSATYTYLGMAKKLEDGLWSYTWNTKNNPNGEYKIAVKVKNTYGTFESFSSFVEVKNFFEKTETDEEVQLKTALKETADYIERQKEVLTNEELETNLVDIEEQDVSTTTEELPQKDSTDDSDALSTPQKEELDKKLNKLATAVRVGDEKAVTDSKREIEELKSKIRSDALADGSGSRNIEKDLDDAVAKVVEDVEKTNKIIKERVQVEAEKDSDKDGIADYDEINLYGTDPFVADTDGDGFIDGAEVLSGYDPTDSRAETLVQFESPKETGVVREDILVVENITTSALTDEEKEDDISPKAIISGKALPNSFVTLYIFSTPVVVTVKTESDGSWQYRFDKELEDGQHEVYVGVTDNAGKIIAKSNPLTFIKTAEAFDEVETPVNGIITEDTQSTDGFISLQVVYFILSVSVVSIGLVLILLGLHLDARPRKLHLKEEASVA